MKKKALIATVLAVLVAVWFYYDRASFWAVKDRFRGEVPLQELVERAIWKVGKNVELTVGGYEVDANSRSVTVRDVKMVYLAAAYGNEKKDLTHEWTVGEIVFTNARPYSLERDRSIVENVKPEALQLDSMKKYLAQFSIADSVVMKNIRGSYTSRLNDRKILVTEVEEASWHDFVFKTDAKRIFFSDDDWGNPFWMMVKIGGLNLPYEMRNVSKEGLRIEREVVNGNESDYYGVTHEESGVRIGGVVKGGELTTDWNPLHYVVAVHGPLSLAGYSSFDVSLEDVTAPGGAGVKRLSAETKIKPTKPFTVQIAAEGVRMPLWNWAFSMAHGKDAITLRQENRPPPETPLMEADLELSYERIPDGAGRQDVLKGSFIVRSAGGDSLTFSFSGRVPTGIHLRPDVVLEREMDRARSMRKMRGRGGAILMRGEFVSSSGYALDFLTMEIKGKGAVQLLLPGQFLKKQNSSQYYRDLLWAFLPAYVFLEPESRFGETVDANIRKLLANGGTVSVNIKPQMPVPMESRIFIVDDAPEEFGVSTTYSPK